MFDTGEPDWQQLSLDTVRRQGQLSGFTASARTRPRTDAVSLLWERSFELPPALRGTPVGLSLDYELRDSAKKFNVSPEQLKEAVRAVGDRADKVETHLKGSKA